MVVLRSPSIGVKKADDWTDTEFRFLGLGVAERGSCWFSCCTTRLRENREGSKIFRRVMDLGENSEAKSQDVKEKV